MSDKIYVIGHKSPDLDSVAAAIAYASYKNKLENSNKYIPQIAGEANKETVFALEKFQFSLPEVAGETLNRNFILVDHNEFSQSVDGIEKANIVEVVDHHKIDFKYSEPIMLVAKPWGSTCSIIYKMFLEHSIDIEKNLAGLMLSAILVDTVITKSPTCTEIDKQSINELAQIAGIADWQQFGMELFKVRSSVSEMPITDIIHSDFKDFNFKAGKFGVGQVETVDLTEFESRENEIVEQLQKLKTEEEYHTVILFITDIIKEGSKFFVISDDLAGVEKALNSKFENNRAWIPGILSRKKQVVPEFVEVFDK